MSMDDGDKAVETPQVNVKFDAAPITDAIRQGFEAYAPRPAAAPQQDAMTQAYTILKEQGWDDDAIRAHLVTSKLMKDEVVREVQSLVGGQRSTNAVQEAERFISRELRSYTKDEPKLKAVEEQLKQNIYKAFNSDQARANALSRVGHWDEGVTEDIIDEQVGKMRELLGLDKPSGKGDALPAKKASGKSEADKETETVSPRSLRENPTAGLNEHQEEFYHARVSSLKLYNGKTADEAHKIALEAARKLPLPNVR